MKKILTKIIIIVGIICLMAVALGNFVFTSNIKNELSEEVSIQPMTVGFLIIASIVAIVIGMIGYLLRKDFT